MATIPFPIVFAEENRFEVAFFVLEIFRLRVKLSNYFMVQRIYLCFYWMLYLNRPYDSLSQNAQIVTNFRHRVVIFFYDRDSLRDKRNHEFNRCLEFGQWLNQDVKSNQKPIWRRCQSCKTRPKSIVMPAKSIIFSLRSQ